METPDILSGSLDLQSGEAVEIEMPKTHWQGLKWLSENHEGDVVAEITDLLKDPNRSDEADSQIVMWYVELYFDAIFGDDPALMIQRSLLKHGVDDTQY